MTFEEVIEDTGLDEFMYEFREHIKHGNLGGFIFAFVDAEGEYETSCGAGKDSHVQRMITHIQKKLEEIPTDKRKEMQ